jgi:hypothetical protein
MLIATRAGRNPSTRSLESHVNPSKYRSSVACRPLPNFDVLAHLKARNDSRSTWPDSVGAGHEPRHLPRLSILGFASAPRPTNNSSLQVVSQSSHIKSKAVVVSMCAGYEPTAARRRRCLVSVGSLALSTRQADDLAKNGRICRAANNETRSPAARQRHVL